MRSNQPDDITGSVLAVAIHHDGGIIVDTPGQFRQPDSDSALMAQVANQSKDFDAFEAWHGNPGCQPHRFPRAVINPNN